MNLIDQLIRDEGVRLKPYRDSVGKLTIGIGRNLDDVGINELEAEWLLHNDIFRAEAALEKVLPWTAELDEVRRAALINLTFNMGIGSLLGFHKTLSLLEAKDFEGASKEMLSSKWAEQVGDRAKRLAEQIRTGTWQ